MKKTKKQQQKQPKSYRDLHWLDKTLDILLIIGILVGLIIILIEFFGSPTPEHLRLLQQIDVFILGIFLADLTRNFLKSRNFLIFLKHQWFDLVILIFIIIAFSGVFLLGVGRLSWLLREEKVAFLLKGDRALSWINRIWKVAFLRKLFKK